ncbi:unnamed protein product, partial [Tenebrio molitor]
ERANFLSLRKILLEHFSFYCQVNYKNYKLQIPSDAFFTKQCCRFYFHISNVECSVGGNLKLRQTLGGQFTEAKLS